MSKGTQLKYRLLAAVSTDAGEYRALRQDIDAALPEWQMPLALLAFSYLGVGHICSLLFVRSVGVVSTAIGKVVGPLWRKRQERAYHRARLNNHLQASRIDWYIAEERRWLDEMAANPHADQIQIERMRSALRESQVKSIVARGMVAVFTEMKFKMKGVTA